MSAEPLSAFLLPQQAPNPHEGTQGDSDAMFSPEGTFLLIELLSVPYTQKMTFYTSELTSFVSFYTVGLGKDGG